MLLFDSFLQICAYTQQFLLIVLYYSYIIVTLEIVYLYIAIKDHIHNSKDRDSFNLLMMLFDCHRLLFRLIISFFITLLNNQYYFINTSFNSRQFMLSSAGLYARIETITAL